MDEAERCHRLAILDHGRLVANGTPLELMQSLDGRTLLVQTDKTRKAQDLLQKIPNVISVAQIGLSLRVLLANDHNVDIASTKQALAAAQIDANVETTSPNLEDVFVSATLKMAEAAA